MSEPLSSGEIEDVLSSIRRLVSEDLRPMQRGPAVPQAEPPRQALILTPALRVVSSTPVPDPVSPGIEKVVAAVGAGITEMAPEFEPEMGDAAPQHDPASDRVWNGSDWQGEDEAQSLEISEPELRDNGAADAVVDPAYEEPGPAAQEPDVPVDAGWAQSGADEAAFQHAAAPEVPVAPAESGWMDDAEAEVIAGLNRTRQDEPVDNLLDDGPEFTLDEEVLRDLVRDLIREELQGHLGERITRNIRKLVRAEIARALAAAELN